MKKKSKPREVKPQGQIVLLGVSDSSAGVPVISVALLHAQHHQTHSDTGTQLCTWVGTAKLVSTSASPWQIYSSVDSTENMENCHLVGHFSAAVCCMTELTPFDGSDLIHPDIPFSGGGFLALAAQPFWKEVSREYFFCQKCLLLSLH